MDLAAELLAVADDAELGQFLGRLVKRTGRAAGRFVRSPAGRALGGILKDAARTALPVIGGAIGTAVAPGVGTAIGGKLGQAAGQAFGLELEGLSPEDQEFEVARRFVRLAGDAARRAAGIAPSIDPRSTAIAVFNAAARKHAPGLLGEVPAAEPLAAMGGGQSGRWVRGGRRIVLLGV